MSEMYYAIGLMSGTSMDGVDAALIYTDGEGLVKPVGFCSTPYSDSVRERIRSCLNPKADKEEECQKLEEELTRLHHIAVEALLEQVDVKRDEISVIGFHGQTLMHDPEKGKTLQIGDGALLAQLCGINVVNDFRTEDVQNGGQGAPLVPVYHRALASEALKPCVLLNIGGVANITWIGKGEDDLMGFDTGPGNALIDDWIKKHTGERYDDQGAIARQGDVNDDVLGVLMSHPYFDQAAPKSLDRNEFNVSPVAGLSLEDGASTLTTFTVESIACALDLCPEKPEICLVTGGGRLNNFMMEQLDAYLGIPVKDVADLECNGDAVEAEAFAYMAVRHLQNKPNSFPGTTGVSQPTVGGVLHQAAAMPLTIENQKKYASDLTA